MHFLIDADLPRSVGDLIRSYGHNATDTRDVGMRRALDATIAQHAQREGLCLLTGDFDFSDVRTYPPADYAGIVVLVIPPTVTSLYRGCIISRRDHMSHPADRLLMFEPDESHTTDAALQTAIEHGSYAVRMSGIILSLPPHSAG